MPQHLILLRGINVSGQKKIKTADLRELLSNSGFKSVQSYIQSGNIIVESALDKTKVASKIEKLIRGKYNFDVPVIVRSKTELKKVLKNNPYLSSSDENLKAQYVCFLSKKPSKENIEKLKEYTFDSEEFTIWGDHVYLYFPKGAGTAKMNNNFIESKLKVTASTRNWRTVNTLFDMI
ncbi:MAG: DUF1697 domain-containing protein [Bacteroidia bacterium]|nr:DUF1697 domain-containing protein [Bacteroidia bacterium]